MAGPHRKGGQTEFFTPRELLSQLGHFDLDPCTATHRPWDTADRHLTLDDDGLVAPWYGTVFMNPPYDFRHIAKWLDRASAHHALALVFARTDTIWWDTYVWGRASGVLFLRGRITFCDRHGNPYPHNCGAPMALVAYGQIMLDRLKSVSYLGKLIHI